MLESRVDGAYLDAIQLLLHGIRVHAPRGDPSRYEEYCSRMLAIEHQVDGGLDPSVAERTATSALGVLEAHGRQVEAYWQERMAELRATAILLLDALNNASLPETMELIEIRERLNAATDPGCLGELRARLTKIIPAVKTVRAASASPPAAGRLGVSVSSLPDRICAEEMIAKWLASGTVGHAVAILLKGIQSINARFGYSNGDFMILRYAQRLAQELQAGEELFRWNGPAFVALLQSPISTMGTRKRAVAMLAQKLDATLKIDGRTVLLSISATPLVLPLQHPVADLLSRIDAFVADSGPQPSG